VYQAQTANGVGVYAIRPGERTPVLVVDNGISPEVTADGRTIVFRRPSDKVGLYRVNIDGSGLTLLVEGDPGSAVILRDDRTVLFTSNRSGVQAMWSVPLAGGPAREILHRFVGAGSLLESPDGRRLLFSGGVVDGRSLNMVCDLPDCTNPHEWPVRLGRWTPDGHGVAYVDRTDPKNIWVQPIDGGSPRPLTKFTEKDVRDFAWSPDGARLAITRGTGLADIVLIKGIR
jgi:Tol biopolymer transport system component